MTTVLEGSIVAQSDSSILIITFMQTEISKFIFRMLLLSLFSFGNAYAQLSPPGLGKAKTAFWSAFGVKRKLDSLGTKASMTYIGLGRKSDPDNRNLFENQAIIVFNHEQYHHFEPNQQYSYAISYRRQNSYDDHPPYRSEGMEQEFRVYGRYAYTLQPADRWKWKNTVRQEFRKFYTTDFSKTDENFQLRTRVKTQLVYHFPTQNKQTVTLSAEGLFAISNYNDASKDWSKYDYKETRLGLYYGFQLPETPVSMDVGYGNNWIKGNRTTQSGVHYLAVDLIWTIPY